MEFNVAVSSKISAREKHVARKQIHAKLKQTLTKIINDSNNLKKKYRNQSRKSHNLSS